jgi:phosphomecalonate degydratase large subunit
LNHDEEKMLGGGCGPAVEKSMEILVALGDIYGAEKMVEIESAQISGVSYKTIGDAGLEYLEDLAKLGAKVTVSSTLNPAGVDLNQWKELGFSSEFYHKQLRIVEAYRKMGVINTCTCTPYLASNLPRLGSHIAWSESSAVCYANSVIGARTNREGGPGALSAAICGRTPSYGYHLDSGRKANLVVEVKTPLCGVDYGTLGFLVGREVGGGVPFFQLQIKPNTNDLKSLGAALASSGAVALYHIQDVTPEYHLAMRGLEVGDVELMIIENSDIKEMKEKLSTTSRKPDLVFLGCPHASLDEIGQLASYVEGKKLKNEVWICTSILVKAAADRMGYTSIIEKAGGRVICDTCMVVAPIEELGFEVIGVDSAKAANYVPSMCGLDVVYDDWKNLLEEKN